MLERDLHGVQSYGSSGAAVVSDLYQASLVQITMSCVIRSNPYRYEKLVAREGSYRNIFYQISARKGHCPA